MIFLCWCFICVPFPCLHPLWLFGSLLFLLSLLPRDGSRLWSRWRWMLVNDIRLNQWSSVGHYLSMLLSLCVQYSKAIWTSPSAYPHLVGCIGWSIFSVMNISCSTFRSRVSPYMQNDPSARELLATIWTINPFLFLASVVSVVCCWDLCTSEKSPRCRWLMKRQGLSLLAVGLETCRFRFCAISGENTSILKGVPELQIHD